jgi:hypothetical protein
VIQILAPLDGDTFTLADTIPITIQYDLEKVPAVHTKFSADAGQSFTTITASGISYNQTVTIMRKSYRWVPVNDSLLNASILLLSYSLDDPRISALSTKPIIIMDHPKKPIQLQYPRGGETFRATDTITIRIRHDIDVIIKTAIQYSKNNGQSFAFVSYHDKSIIIAGAVGTDFFKWVPAADSLHTVSIVLKTFSYLDPQFQDQLTIPITIK